MPATRANATYTFVFLALLSIGIATLGKNTQVYTITHKVLASILVPVFVTTKALDYSFYWASNFFTNQIELVEKIEALQKERIALSLKISQQARRKQDYEHLLLLENIKNSNFPNLQTAQIISSTHKANTIRIYINKGKQSGVEVGGLVFDKDGIVGQVMAVNLFTASVIPITDILHHIPIVVKRTGERMIAKGTGKNTLHIYANIYSSKASVGDVVVTSGLGGRFFRNYPVGVITDIVTSSNDELTIIIEPSAKLSTNEFVAIQPALRRFPIFPNAKEN